MIAFDSPLISFIALALASQILLVGFFAAYSWRGVPATLLGLWYLTTPYSWWLATGPLVFAAWTAFGYTVDLYRPINWRNPPRWPILIPYIALLWIGLFGLWMPLWRLGLVFWLAFGVMLAIHTALNIASHGKRARLRPVR
jgi:hypothetical protein